MTVSSSWARRLRRWLPLTPVLVVVLVGVGWWVVVHLDLGRGARYDEAAARLRDRTFPRPALEHVPAGSGVAADHYDLAEAACPSTHFNDLVRILRTSENALLPALPPESDPLIEPGSREMPPECRALGIAARTTDPMLVQLDAEACTAIAACRPAYPHLQAGARAPDATGPNYLWRPGPELNGGGEHDRRTRVALWLLDARIRGDLPAYLDTMADALRFTTDLGRGGPYSLLAAPLRELITVHLWSQIPAMTDAQVERWVSETRRAEAGVQTIDDASTNAWLWGAGPVIGGDRLYPTRASRDQPFRSRHDPVERLLDGVALRDELRRWDQTMGHGEETWSVREARYSELIEERRSRWLGHHSISVIESVKLWDEMLTRERAWLRAVRVALNWVLWERADEGDFAVGEVCPFTGESFRVGDGHVRSPVASPGPISLILPE